MYTIAPSRWGAWLLLMMSSQQLVFRHVWLIGVGDSLTLHIFTNSDFSSPYSIILLMHTHTHLLREGAKFMGTCAGQKEIFRFEKSLRPFIFSWEKSLYPVIFFIEKSVCPIIFPVKKSVCPFIWIESKAPFKSYKKGIMTMRNDE